MSRIVQVNKERRCQDHISNLPECIIGDILSRLPTKYAVQTSILSKDWEYKWTSIHNIKINDAERLHSNEPWKLDLTHFQNFVDRILFLSRNFNKFRLVCWESYPFDRLGVWITTALKRNIESLELLLPGIRSKDFIVPPRICNNTYLKELKLIFCTLKVPHSYYFPSITSLHLAGVRMRNGLKKDDPIVLTLPVLKSCLLRNCEWHVSLVEIHSPALSTLRCVTSSCLTKIHAAYSINIYGASLEKFECSGDFPERINLNESKVLSADLINHHSCGLCINKVKREGLLIRKLLKGFSDITNLQLSAWTCKAIAESQKDLLLPQFDKLQRLVMSVCSNAKLLFELLHSAPSLEFLEIEVDKSLDRLDRDVADYVPHCVVSQLKEVKFKKSFGKPPYNLANFFLANGLELRKAYLVGNEDKIVEQLLTFPRASACLTIVSEN